MTTSKHNLICAGDTRPTPTLTSLANNGHGTDVLLLQNMGPILDFSALPHNSQYLLNVRMPYFHADKIQKQDQCLPLG